MKLRINLKDLGKGKSAGVSEKKTVRLNFGALKRDLPKQADAEKHAPAKIRLKAAAEQRPTPAPAETKGLKIKFTEGTEYDLDKIIEMKRRDNSKVPLIVHYEPKNAYDVAIIEAIDKMILDHYGVSYDEDPKSERYYKNATVLDEVPEFYYTFDEYFNQYFGYYYDKYKDKKAGSISLSSVSKDTVLSDIYRYYDSVESGQIADVSDASSNADNVVDVQYDYGTMPGEGMPFDEYLAFDPNKLRFGVIDGQLTLTYDGSVISSPVEYGKTNFGVDYATLKRPAFDIENEPGVTMVGTADLTAHPSIVVPVKSNIECSSAEMAFSQNIKPTLDEDPNYGVTFVALTLHD